MQKEYDSLYKILLIGNSNVGKSSIMKRFADDTFHEGFLPTNGVDFKIRTIIYNKKYIMLQIWDIAGQETITTKYYKGAFAIIIVFDISDRQSFVDVSNWLEGKFKAIIETKKHAPEGVVLGLVGNKSDLAQVRKVTSEEATAFASQHQIKYVGMIAFQKLETSSKDSTNIQQAFVIIVEEILNKQKQAAAQN